MPAYAHVCGQVGARISERDRIRQHTRLLADVCGQVGARISERDRLLREKQVKQHRDSLQKRGIEVRQVYVTCVCVCVCVCVCGYTVIQGFGAEARRGDAADTSSQMRQTLRP
jgi:hypothetical protein